MVADKGLPLIETNGQCWKQIPMNHQASKTDSGQGDQAIMIPAVAEDGSLFPIEKLHAHEIAQLHLAISVFITDGDRLLIQQRAHDKYHCPGKWANTCCTHPHWGESVVDCAARRLREELGVSIDLIERLTLDYKADVGGGLTEHERVTVFAAEADSAGLEVRLNPAEVAATRWISLNDLKAEMAAKPENFTPWFRIYMERFPGLAF